MKIDLRANYYNYYKPKEIIKECLDEFYNQYFFVFVLTHSYDKI